MENSLVDLIIQYSDVSGLSLRQMSLRAGLGESTVAIVVRGDRKPGFDFCVAIADVLKISPDEALRLAGLLPPQPAPVQEEAEILYNIRSLPPGDREAALRMIRGLAMEAYPPQLSPLPAVDQPPEEGERVPQLLGDAVLDLDHPVRMLYETLFEVLDPAQFAYLVTRLAEKAAENQTRQGRLDNGRQQCENCTIPAGDQIATGGRRKPGT